MLPYSEFYFGIVLIFKVQHPVAVPNILKNAVSMVLRKLIANNYFKDSIQLDVKRYKNNNCKINMTNIYVILQLIGEKLLTLMFPENLDLTANFICL